MNRVLFSRNSTAKKRPALTRPRPRPPARRAYGQVTKLSQDAWQTPDKRIFQRSYLAYRHLKHLKETNQLALFQQSAAQQIQIKTSAMETCAHVMPFDGHENAQTTVERTQDGAVTSFVLFGRSVNLDSLPDEPCPYHLMRLWSRNATGKYSGVIVHRDRPDSLPDLPEIPSGPAVEQARPEPVSVVRSRDDELPVASQPDAKPSELLRDFIALGQRARKRCREFSAERLRRYEPRVRYLNAVSEEYMLRARHEAAEWMAEQSAAQATGDAVAADDASGKQARRKVSFEGDEE